MNSFRSKIINKLQSPVLISVTVGLALGIGFIIPALSVAALFGVVGCLYLIREAKNSCQAGLFLGIAWTIKSLCAILWFWSAYPISWIALASPAVQIVIISFYWITGALWLGVGGYIFGFLLKYIAEKKILSPVWWSLLVPVVWVVGEIAGAFTFSLVTLGPGSYLQSYFSFGFIGYLLGYAPVGIFMAAFGGVYMLSIVMVLVGLLFSILLHRQLYVYSIVLGIGMGCIAGIPYVSTNVPTPSLTAISINTIFDAGYLSTEAGQQGRAVLLDEAVRKAVSYKSPYIILPEDSRYLDNRFGGVDTATIVDTVRFAYPESESAIIDSGRVDLLDGTAVVRAHVVDTKNNSVAQFDKQYLVPQGEYVPYLYGVIMRVVGYGPLIRKIESDSAYRPGPLTQTDDTSSNFPALLFCFESVRPDGVIRLTKDRALPFIAHPISHAWFHSSEVLWQQLDVMLQIQARLSGVPIISAGNMVPGKLYAPDGTISEGTLIEKGERYEVRLFSF